MKHLLLTAGVFATLAAFSPGVRVFAHEHGTHEHDEVVPVGVAVPGGGATKPVKTPPKILPLKSPPNPNSRYLWEKSPRDLGQLARTTGAHDGRIELSLVGDPTLFFVTRDAKMPLVALKSHDGGDSFHTVQVAPTGDSVDSHGENSPCVVCDGGGVLWQRDTTEGNNIVFAASPNWGHSYDAPRVLNDVPDKAYYAGAAFQNEGSNNRICVAWLDSRDPEGQKDDTASIYCTISNDGGKMWSPNVRVAQGVCPCCRPTTLIEGQNVVIAWRKVFAGNIRDIVCAHSSDGGRTWSAPIRVGVDNWKLKACPDTGPQLAKVGNSLYAAWYSAGQPEPGIRLAVSRDGGKTWSKPVIASRGVLDASQPALSVGGGKVLLAMRARPNRGDGFEAARLYFGAVTANGNVEPLEEVPNSQGATQARVSLDDAGRVCALWNAVDTVWMLRGRVKASLSKP